MAEVLALVEPGGVIEETELGLGSILRSPV